MRNRSNGCWKVLTLILWLILPDSARAAGLFENLAQIQQALGFRAWYRTLEQSPAPGKVVRIAILDKGFSGWEKDVGFTLPTKTQYHTGPVTPPADFKSDHGLRMAQLLTALTSDEMRLTEWIPELHLYPVYGFTNFKAAIDDVIQQKLDMVLYAEVWEYGGNFDGKGFINAEVNRTTKAGVLWVNAAGNFNQSTFNTGIRTGTDDWVNLPNPNHALALRCQPDREKSCNVRAVLSWNDFKDDITPGTDKDLDLVLTDDFLNIIETGALHQTPETGEPKPGFSKYPREIITSTVPPGLYFLRVKNRSKNFKSGDTLRITVDGEGVTVPSHTKRETLLNPADNPTVITVGASDSERSGISQKLGKPELWSPSALKLSGVGEFRGSSNSAAMVAAGMALMKSRYPELKRESLITRTGIRRSWKNAGLSLGLLGFRPTGPGCFLEIPIQNPPEYLARVLADGGIMVATNFNGRMMVPYDPITLQPGLYRMFPDDMVVARPEGYSVFRRHGYVPSGSVEVFQRPLEAGPCRTPADDGRVQFRLPLVIDSVIH